MVEQRRKRTVSKENASPHHLRRRRLQRRAQPAVEERAAAACERGGTLHYREPPAARYLQVEQDRAPVILPHFHQLAGKALTSLEMIIELLSHTTTQQGLTVTAVVDQNSYPTGIKVSDEEMSRLNIERNAFHGDWNYTMRPHRVPARVSYYKRASA